MTNKFIITALSDGIQMGSSEDIIKKEVILIEKDKEETKDNSYSYGCNDGCGIATRNHVKRLVC